MATNIYANKIYAEGPSAIWTLDESITGTPVALPATINLSGLYGIEADLYGLESGPGYYISTSSSSADLKAEGNALPIVAGAPNSTLLKSAPLSSSSPSLIVPGKGFLHDYGKNKRSTVEFWIKCVLNEDLVEKRIFGPISSTDGLYINGPFLTLKVGNSVKSHYVGQWGRPMHIAISYTNEKIALIINGATVLLLDFDKDNTTFSSNPADNWLGFYALQNSFEMLIDCIAIYPYNISSKQAKLHFIYGQAVESTELRNSEISDVPVVIDYAVSGLAGNHNYPDHSSWSDGYLKNLSINNRHLSSPNLEVPELSFKDSTISISDWYSLNYTDNVADTADTSTFMRIKAKNGASYWDYPANFYYEGFRIGSKKADALYLTGRADRFMSSQTETIVDIIDSLSNTFSIKITYPSSGGTSATIKYYFNDIVLNEIHSITVTSSTEFSIGFHVQDLLDYSDNENLSEFFANPSDLAIFFGGSNTYSSTFSGKIYSFGFLSALDIARIDSVSSDGDVFSNGVIDGEVTTLKTFISGFSVMPTMSFGAYGVDVSSYGYWSDIIPLKVLAKQVNSNYAINYVQLNVDFPSFTSTSSAIVRTYVSLINTNDSETMSGVLTDTAISSSGVIEPGSGWTPTQRFEFVDGNILVIPSNIASNPEASIKIEFEIKNKEISRNPLKIRSLEIASHSFADNTEPIGTKYGKEIHTVGANCIIELYKGTAPYMFLGEKTGIKLIDKAGRYSYKESYIKVEINENYASNYYVSVIQFAIKRDANFSAASTYNIADIKLPGNITSSIIATSVGVESITGEVSISGLPEGITATVLVNGVAGQDLKRGHWSIVTIGFSQPLNFGNAAADPSVLTQIQFLGNFRYDNISVYQIPDQKLQQQLIYNLWNDPDSDNTINNSQWNDIDDEKIWQDVAIKDIVSGGNITLDPETIYRDYIRSLVISSPLSGKMLVFPITKWTTYTGYNEDRNIYIPL